MTLYKKRSQAMQISLRKTYFSQCVEGWVRWVLGLFLVGSDPDRSERNISEQTEIEINFNFPTNYLGNRNILPLQSSILLQRPDPRDANA